MSLSLIVIFQPELRRFLGFLGQADIVSKLFSSNNSRNRNKKIDVVKELIESVKYLSKSHTGALIVFQSDLSNTYYDVGTRLNADLSTELLLTIFHVNTPLHDGAVVIREREIMAAACILPLAEASGVSRELGTRHRAALGISENTDAIVLVVSEETGIVSMARDGILTRPLTVKALEEILNEIYTARKSRILTFLNTLKNEAEGEEHE